jgi:hypothetical protein
MSSERVTIDNPKRNFNKKKSLMTPSYLPRYVHEGMNPPKSLAPKVMCLI